MQVTIFGKKIKGWCGQCRFFYPTEKSSYGQPVHGHCRRYPPEKCDEIFMPHILVQVSALYWCGEFKKEFKVKNDNKSRNKPIKKRK